MKRLLAFLLLLSHMNTSMFLPQVPEVDVYNHDGEQIDDINSVVELFMVYLGWDTVPDDEDNDSGQQFHLVTIDYYISNPGQYHTNQVAASYKAGNDFFDPGASRLSFLYYDVKVPPPRIV